MCVYVCMCVSMWVCMYMCICVSMCVYVYMFICVCVYVYVCLCVCVRMCVYVCVCVCVCVPLRACDCAVHPPPHPMCGACGWAHVSVVCSAPGAATLEASRAPQSLLPPPSRVPPPPKFRGSVTAPPQKAHKGECLLLGEGARRVAWAPVPQRRPLSVQHLLAPRPHSPRPLTRTSFRESTDVHRRLPAAPQRPRPPSLPCAC